MFNREFKEGQLVEVRSHPYKPGKAKNLEETFLARVRGISSNPIPIIDRGIMVEPISDLTFPDNPYSCVVVFEVHIM